MNHPGDSVSGETVASVRPLAGAGTPIKPIDTRMRRPWPEYWTHLKYKEIRAAVGQELSCGAPGAMTGVPDAAAGGADSKAIRLETERRWQAFCRNPQDLEAYKAEVAQGTDARVFTTLSQRRAVEDRAASSIGRRLRMKRQALQRPG